MVFGDVLSHGHDLDVAAQAYRAPALPPVGRWEKGAPVLPEERARNETEKTRTIAPIL